MAVYFGKSKNFLKKLEKKQVDIFLVMLVVSLIGNACADYAFLWHGISQLGSESVSKGKTLTSFYVGQALGVVFLSPLLAVYLDRFTRFYSSVALDVLYAILLLVMGVFYKYEFLSANSIFLFSLMSAAIAILHKSSVGFAAVQKMSESSGITDVTAKFIAALNIPFMFGSLLSGFAYKYLGFNGCMAIGILTFLPMPFVYWMVFKDEDKEKTKKTEYKFLVDLKEGMKVLLKDPLLIGTASSISVLNIASAILPGIVGIAFASAYPGRTDYASLAISLSILVGVLSTKSAGTLAKAWQTKNIVPISVLPATLTLLVCLWYPHPLLFGLMFLFSCVGSAARNVSTGSLRVARVPKNLIARVNTVYTALLYLGQSLGGVIIVKAVENDMRTATGIIIGCFALASLISFLLLPRDNIASIIELK